MLYAMISCTEVDAEKVGASSKGVKSGVERWDVIYPPLSADKRMILYIPYPHDAPDDGVASSGVRDGDTGKYKSARRTIPLLLDNSKKHELAFGALIDSIAGAMSRKYGSTIKSPLKSYQSDGETRFSIWCKIIESNDGVIYTRAFDVDGNKLDVATLDVPMTIRPAVSLQITKTQQNGYSMTCYITEMCVIKRTQSQGWSVLSPKSGKSVDV